MWNPHFNIRAIKNERVDNDQKIKKALFAFH